MPPPLDQTKPLYCRLRWSIYTIYIREKLGRGEGGEHTFILKILKTLIFPFLTGNINAFIPIFKMRKRSKKDAKTRFCEHHLYGMTAWQTTAARIAGLYIFSSLNIHGVRKY